MTVGTGEPRFSALLGVALVVVYTMAVTLSDAVTKHLAATFAAPQILMICAATILGLSLLAAAPRPRRSGGWRRLATKAPRAMALRAGMTVLAAVFFYHAFATLPFADVFLFVALVPIFAGLLSAPVLGERVAPVSWVALGLSGLGVFMLFPEGRADVTFGHVMAFLAAFTGTVAIVMARDIARVESAPLALVFWPQAAIFATMALIAPLVWQPIGWADAGLAVLCGLALFGARYALVVALQVLPAYTATPLLNLQFVWMVIIGMVVFNEIPGCTRSWARRSSWTPGSCWSGSSTSAASPRGA
jgi:S-adenosylmethionine uptake transporter